MRQHLAGCVLIFAAALPIPRMAVAQATIDLEVTAQRLDQARLTIQPSLGATKYDFTQRTIEAIPLGDQAPLNQVLLRAPGVVQDSFGQVHIRGDHSNNQFRLDGVQLPEGLSLFNQILATQYANQMSLITGALPAQYGFRQAGVIDITLKSGRSDPGAEAKMTVGSRNYLQPSFSYGGATGPVDYFVSGQFLHNGAGIENPEASYSAIHNDTDQWYGLAKIGGIIDDNTRVNFIGGYASAAFQIPQRSGQAPGFPVNGIFDFNSALLDQRQWERTAFGILSLQKSYDTLDFQLSGFARYSKLTYQPDPLGDLMFNGIAPWTNRKSFAVGVQGDGSWKAASNHTVRGGFLVQRERATSFNNAQVLAVDDDGAPVTDVPSGLTEGTDQLGWLYGFYLQDEWRVLPTVTINFGARFDGYSGVIAENQLSPRINVVWQPNPVVTVHAGYARYFTPPTLFAVTDGIIVGRQGTSGAFAGFVNGPPLAERSHYFDVGVTLKPAPGLSLGIDAYWKIAQNLLDKGQFGAPILLTSFNYANAEVKGFEITGSYDQGPWSVYGNLSWSEAKATNINSGQFNFAAEDLAFIAQNYIYVDHNQSWTASAGVAYTFNYRSDWATRLSADVYYGNGLRKTVLTPNDEPTGPYGVFNVSAIQKIPIKGTRGTHIRFDVLNLFDTSYQIRDGTGVGVGAPQYGLRRTFLVGLSQKF